MLVNLFIKEIFCLSKINPLWQTSDTDLKWKSIHPEDQLAFAPSSVPQLWAGEVLVQYYYASSFLHCQV